MSALIAYEVTNAANGKRYIGMTVRTVRQRWNQHLADARQGSTAPLHRAIRKHGAAAFTVRAVASAATLDDLFAVEELLVQQEGTFWPVGYNATRGGRGVPGYHPPAGSRPLRFQDLQGQAFGRLTVVTRAPNAGAGIRARARWFCRCECGAEAIVHASALRSGNTVSCGCAKRERSRREGWKLNRRHGRTGSRVHTTWSSMIQRCTDANHKSFRSYGGAGIGVCERWLAFENFLADMGEQPAGMWLGRHDTSLGYLPGNCSWMSRAQVGAIKSTSRLIEYQGKTQPLAAWAKEHGVSRKLLRDRLARGWAMREALATDPKAYHGGALPQNRKPCSSGSGSAAAVAGSGVGTGAK